jgi:hypothetical protein
MTARYVIWDHKTSCDGGDSTSSPLFINGQDQGGAERGRMDRRRAKERRGREVEGTDE